MSVPEYRDKSLLDPALLCSYASRLYLTRAHIKPSLQAAG